MVQFHHDHRTNKPETQTPTPEEEVAPDKNGGAVDIGNLQSTLGNYEVQQLIASGQIPTPQQTTLPPGFGGSSGDKPALMRKEETSVQREEMKEEEEMKMADIGGDAKMADIGGGDAKMADMGEEVKEEEEIKMKRDTPIQRHDEEES